MFENDSLETEDQIARHLQESGEGDVFEVALQPKGQSTEGAVTPTLVVEEMDTVLDGGSGRHFEIISSEVDSDSLGFALYVREESTGSIMESRYDVYAVDMDSEDFADYEVATLTEVQEENL